MTAWRAGPFSYCAVTRVSTGICLNSILLLLYIAEDRVDINNGLEYDTYTYKRGCWRFSGHTLLTNGRLWLCVYLRLFPDLFPVHPLISLYPSIYVTVLLAPFFSLVKVIEEIVEMMENSPDPGETEEEDEEESSPCSSRNNPSLLEEIRQLSQASNNNCSYEGKIIQVTF